MNSENFFEKKINGEPVEKRFKLSREPFAKERIKAIKDSVKKLQGEYPEVLSLCLFGSMVKGNIKKTSDIDGYLFVDVDMVKEKHLKDKDLKITEEDLLFGESIGILFKEEIENEYSLGLKKKLFSILHLSAEQLEHLRITPISEEIIDRQVQDIVQQLKLISSYKESYRAWEESYPTEKVDDLKVLADYYKKKPEYPKLPRPSQNLRSMFHLDVGGGIRFYRNYLIDKLEAMGDLGEKIWKIIIGDSEFFEQNFQVTNKHYPRNLTQAREIYGRNKNK